MVVLPEGKMKGHIVPHMAVIQCSKVKLASGDWTAQIDTVVKDQFTEIRHKKFQILFRMNKWEQTILSKQSLGGLPLAVES